MHVYHVQGNTSRQQVKVDKHYPVWEHRAIGGWWSLTRGRGGGGHTGGRGFLIHYPLHIQVNTSVEYRGIDREENEKKISNFPCMKWFNSKFQLDFVKIINLEESRACDWLNTISHRSQPGLLTCHLSHRVFSCIHWFFDKIVSSLLFWALLSKQVQQFSSQNQCMYVKFILSSLLPA